MTRWNDAELTAAIEAAWASADKHEAIFKAAPQEGRAAASAYLRTGQLLLKLKELGEEIYKAKLKQIGRSESRANELIRLASGAITIEELREGKRKSVAKSRAKKKEAEAAKTPEQKFSDAFDRVANAILEAQIIFDRLYFPWHEIEHNAERKTLAFQALSEWRAIVDTIWPQHPEPKPVELLRYFRAPKISSAEVEVSAQSR
jgi:hypothetical protein